MYSSIKILLITCQVIIIAIGYTDGNPVAKCKFCIAKSRTNLAHKIVKKQYDLKSDDEDSPFPKADTAYYNQFSSVDARIKAEVTRKLLRTVNGAPVSTKFRSTEFPSYTYTTMQMIADVNNTKYGGIPYFLMNYNDSAYRDLLADNKASVLLTDSTTGRCNNWVLGSKDLNCHRAVFLGPFVDASREEAQLVYPEFVRRYPGVRNLNQTNYFIAKVDTKAIYCHLQII